MHKDEFRLALGQTCLHCGHVGSMEIVASHTPNSHLSERRFVYELLSCPSCAGVTLRRSGNLGAMDESVIDSKTLYPFTPDDRFAFQPPLRHLPPANQVKSRAFILKCLNNIHYYVKEWKSTRV